MSIYSLGIDSDKLQAVEKFLPELNDAPKSLLETFSLSLKKLKKYGVNNLGVRVIDSEGYTKVFSTNLKWCQIPQSKLFQKLIITHMNNELVKVRNSDFHYLTRSPSIIDSDYLSMLNSVGINNSVLKYDFTDDKIIIYYFMFDKLWMHNLLLNNMHEITTITNELSQFINLVMNSEASERDKFSLLTRNTKDYLFKDKYSKSLYLEYGNSIVNITPREANCLKYISFGMTNKLIAQKLGISCHTVKSQVQSLRAKFEFMPKGQICDLYNSGKIRFIQHR